MMGLSKTLTAVLAVSFTTAVNGLNSCLSSKCWAGAASLFLSRCSLTDDDLDDLATCFDDAGRSTIEAVDSNQQDSRQKVYEIANRATGDASDAAAGVEYLYENGLTRIPSDLFTGMTSVRTLHLYDNQITSLEAETFQPMASTMYNFQFHTNQLTTLPSGLFAGMKAVRYLYIQANPLATLPSGIFDDVSSVQKLDLHNHELTTLPSGLFDNLGSLKFLYLSNGMLTTLDVNVFDGLTSAEMVDLRNNALTTLPDGVFDTLGTGTSLRFLALSGNSGLQCIPTSSATGVQTSSSSSSTNTFADEVVTAGLCECTDVAKCANGFSCNTGTEGYTCDAQVACTVDGDCDDGAGEVCCPSTSFCEVPDAAAACGDPHMTGFRGQKFDFTGKDGAWYAVVSDLPHLHLNMRVTSPVPSLPEITYITGVSIITTDADGLYHTIVISVSDPHSMESACSVGVPSCLADGALHVVANGEEIMLTPDEVTLAPGVAIAAVNLPGECRSFGFEQYWEKKKLQLAQPGRRLSGSDVLQDMSDWVLADPTATNMVECEDYIAAAVDGDDLFDHQSEHASFQIMTPTATIRLSHGRLHQLPMRDPTNKYDLPDHLAWQMNLAIDHSEMNLDATGILGETLVPTLDQTGAPIMQGMEAIRGAQEDYRVKGPLDVFFTQDQHHE